MELAQRILKGDRRAVARLISMAENFDPQAQDAMRLLHPHSGRAHIVGVTGPPGAGKSTLIDRLAKSYRLLNKKVGIIAVDPSSPFTGGAILGDRIRMSDLNTDSGVFIRSMGTRGHLGGLSRAVCDAMLILDAFGMDIIIIETVGAGQSEVEIASLAHTTILVEMPGLGDDIQTIKAGIMEIGDIFVVNKADRQGVERTEMELKAMLDLDSEEKAWTPPIMRTIANSGEGITALRDAIDAHRAHLVACGDWNLVNHDRIRAGFMALLRNRLTAFITENPGNKPIFDAMTARIVRREIDPYTAADELMAKLTSIKH
jgi:LAO/AO transport system kinase